MAELSYDREYSLELSGRIDNPQIGRILRGSIDMHVHFGPDTRPRRYNAIETALIAREAGLRGIVLKCHSYPTAPIASLVSEVVPGISVFGGICLEYEVGGLSPHAVEASARMGAKVVWMPVFCSTNSRPLVVRKLGLKVKGEGISILGPDGKLVPEVVDILGIIKDYDMVLATGHISGPEIIALVEQAKQIGVGKIVVTHALSCALSESILKPEERAMLVKEGVLMEHTAAEISPTSEGVNPLDMIEAIKSEGPENCVLSTDFGAIPFPTISEGMRMLISVMIKYGFAENDIVRMVKQNPERLLGLEPESL